MLKEDGYSDEATLYAESSPYKIILTDLSHLREDFFNYPLEEIDDVLELLLAELKKNQNGLNKIYKGLVRKDNRINKLEKQNGRYQNFIYFLLIVIFFLCFFIIIIIINKFF